MAFQSSGVLAGATRLAAKWIVEPFVCRKGRWKLPAVPGGSMPAGPSGLMARYSGDFTAVNSTDRYS